MWFNTRTRLGSQFLDYHISGQQKTTERNIIKKYNNKSTETTLPYAVTHIAFIV